MKRTAAMQIVWVLLVSTTILHSSKGLKRGRKNIRLKLINQH